MFDHVTYVYVYVYVIYDKYRRRCLAALGGRFRGYVRK